MCILSRKAFHFVYLVKIKSHFQFGVLFGPTFGIEHSGGHQVYTTCSARLVSSNSKMRTVSVDVFCPAYSFCLDSAKHYDEETTEPISYGICSLEKLLSWSRNEANPFNVAVTPLAPRVPHLASCLHRTLVSHDMMGGYLDDRFIIH